VLQHQLLLKSPQPLVGKSTCCQFWSCQELVMLILAITYCCLKPYSNLTPHLMTEAPDLRLTPSP